MADEKLHSNLAVISNAFSPLTPCVSLRPRFSTLLISQGNGPVLAQADNPVPDLFMIDVPKDSSYCGVLSDRLQGSILDSLHPVKYCTQSLRLVKRGCMVTSDGADLRRVWTPHTLDSFVDEPEDDEISTETLTLEWKSEGTRRKFVRTSAWKREFEDAFRLLQKEGKVSDIEHWKVSIQPWPDGRAIDRPDTAVRTTFFKQFLNVLEWIRRVV